MTACSPSNVSFFKASPSKLPPELIKIFTTPYTHMYALILIAAAIAANITDSKIVIPKYPAYQNSFF